MTLPIHLKGAKTPSPVPFLPSIMSNAQRSVASGPPSGLSWMMRAYLFLAVLGAASWAVPQIPPWLFLTFAIALSLPSVGVAAHGATVAGVVASQSLQPGRLLHGLSVRRSLRILLGATVAVLLTALLLLQGVLFTTSDWWIVATVPVVAWWVERRVRSALEGQYRNPVLASRMVRLVSIGVTALILGIGWFGLTAFREPGPQASDIEQAFRYQQSWQDAPSHAIRTALDAMVLWDTAGHRLTGLAEGALRPVLLAVLAPIAAFAHLVGLVLGLKLDAQEWQRAFAAVPSADATPVPIGPRRATWVALFAAVWLLILLTAAAALESWAHRAGRVAQVMAVPQCARIGQQFYRIEAVTAVYAKLGQSSIEHARLRAEVCSGTAAVEQAAATGIEAYLDWYYSLWGDLSRTATLLAGNGDALMEKRFRELVTDRSDFKAAEAQVAGSAAKLTALSDALLGPLRKELEASRIVPDTAWCQSVVDRPLLALPDDMAAFQARLVASGGAGVATGGLAAAVTAKAMGKASVKAATKVLVKVAGKKFVSKGAAVTAGAVIGSILGPVGTMAGAALGAAVGVTISLLVEVGILKAEEAFQRDELRADLQAAVRDALASSRLVIGCPSAPAPARG